MAERPGILRIGDRVVFSGAEYCVVFSTVRVAEASSCGAMSAIAINALRARCSAIVCTARSWSRFRKAWTRVSWSASQRARARMPELREPQEAIRPLRRAVNLERSVLRALDSVTLTSFRSGRRL